MNSVLLMFASIASLISFGNSMTVTAHVKDTDGNPAVGAVVKIWTDKDRYQGLSRSPIYDYFEAATDTNGMAVLRFPCHSQSFQCCAYGDNYYQEKGGYVYVKATLNYATWTVTLLEHSKDISFTLRRKRNPTSLCYRQPSPFIKLPKDSGEFGFDLLMNDWIEPYGDGRSADFYVQREISPTNSEVTINCGIVFRGDGNGAYVRKKIKTTSDFKTDYEADTNGTYQACLPMRHYPAPSNPKYTYAAIAKEDEYIVMRTRVEKDEKGNIVKANYSAMLGTVQMYQHFRQLGYVFNPTPNDPNLEMDLEKSVDLEKVKWERQHPKKRKNRKRRQPVSPPPNDTNLEPKR